jgi:uncharacterized membrane protein YfcA
LEHAKTVLYVLLAVFGMVFVAAWAKARRSARAPGSDAASVAVAPTPYQLLVGVVTDFLDTLGIGSFATTTALYRARRTIDDRLLPGTLNVGHTIPTIVQAFIFIGAVAVEPVTLVSMIAASLCGAWFGAGFVAGWSRKRVQAVMGAALLLISVVIVVRLTVHTEGGTATGLTGWRLAAGVAGNFVLGILMTMGVGLYAPCFVLVWLLGMNLTTAFPIMMGSCAFLMPIASLRFLREQCVDLRAALGLTLGGIPAVLVAGLIVKELPLEKLKWLVVLVVLYTAVSLLIAARRAQATECAADVRP